MGLWILAGGCCNQFGAINWKGGTFINIQKVGWIFCGTRNQLLQIKTWFRFLLLESEFNFNILIPESQRWGKVLRIYKLIDQKYMWIELDGQTYYGGVNPLLLIFKPPEVNFVPAIQILSWNVPANKHKTSDFHQRSILPIGTF